METRALVVALIAILNFAVDTLEKLVSEDGGEKAKEKGARPSRAKAKTSSHSKKDDDDDADADDADDDTDSDEPSEDDIIDAVKAAQKVIDKADITKILKSKGKADRASEVEPERRQAVIDALEKAIEDAE